MRLLACRHDGRMLWASGTVSGAQPLPVAYSPEGEPRKSLARFKTSLVRRWKPTRMKELFESVDLTWFLVALDRSVEARAIAQHLLAVAPFEPADQNLWSPVGYACCSLANIHHRSGDDAGRQQALQPIRTHPFHAALHPELARATKAKLEAELETATGETPTWSRHYLARALAKAAFFAETGRADAGFSWSGSYDPRPFDDLITRGCALLSERL